MKDSYPDLLSRRESIASITKMEEEKFLETLESGTRMLDELIAKHSGTRSADASAIKTKFMIPGNEAFKLYDTYGFPFDLTKEIVAEKGLSVDEEGFKAAQAEAQTKSRSAWSGSGEKDVTFYAKLHKQFGDTMFTGYEKYEEDTKIKAIIKDNKVVDSLKEGEEGEILLFETPFYAESGGQVTDTGTLAGRSGSLAEVIDVQKPSGALIVHRVKMKHGGFATENSVKAVIDIERRKSIARHHTSTHLLHKALRTILGTHVTQAGSLVTPDYFRFDFTHLAGLKPEEIKAAEQMVNKAILDNMAVTVNLMKIDDARKLGAMALFGEKYGEDVRAVSVRDHVARNDFSLELCGGTHVSRTGDIGFFKITSESSVAAGTRRIEAVAGHAAEAYFYKLQDVIDTLKDTLKSSSQDIPEKLGRLIGKQKVMEKEISKLKSQLASGGAADLMKDVKEIDGIKVLAGRVENLDGESLRKLTDGFKSKLGSGIVILLNTEDGKVTFAVAVTPDTTTKGKSAGKIAKNIAVMLGGSGGGRPDFAQGGGKDISKIDGVISNIAEVLK
jgi:alanyl-tRNA synthetase